MVRVSAAPKTSVKPLQPRSKISKPSTSRGLARRMHYPPAPLSVGEQLELVDSKLEAIAENMRIIARDIADIKKSFTALFDHIGLTPPFESV